MLIKGHREPGQRRSVQGMYWGVMLKGQLIFGLGGGRDHGFAVDGYEGGNGRRCGILVPAVTAARDREGHSRCIDSGSGGP